MPEFESFLVDKAETQKIKEFNKFINEIIVAYGGKGEMLTVNQIQELRKIVDEINKLSERGITTDNFTKKAEAFFKHIDILKNDFGLNTLGINLPFNRPTDLKIKFDNLLESYGLNNEQIQVVTKEFFNTDTRRPKEKFIQPLFTVSKTKDGKITAQRITKFITPLAKKEHYKDSVISDDDETDITINITIGELKILEKYVKDEYGNYYMGITELFLKDLIQDFINEIKQKS